MSSEHPTGMGEATAIHFRKIKRDMELYSRANHNNVQHYYDDDHQLNAIGGGAAQPKISFVERFIHYLLH